MDFGGIRSLERRFCREMSLIRRLNNFINCMGSPISFANYAYRKQLSNNNLFI